MAITNTLISTTAANVYASVGNTVVATVYFYNQSGASALVEVFAVPAGGTANANTQVYGNLVIVATDTYVMDVEKLLFSNDDALMANTNIANTVTVTVTYTGA